MQGLYRPCITVLYITGNKGKTRPALKTEDAHAWMERYFNLLGDHMPHIDQIHLQLAGHAKRIVQQ